MRALSLPLTPVWPHQTHMTIQTTVPISFWSMGKTTGIDTLSITLLLLFNVFRHCDNGDTAKSVSVICYCFLWSISMLLWHCFSLPGVQKMARLKRISVALGVTPSLAFGLSSFFVHMMLCTCSAKSSSALKMTLIPAVARSDFAAPAKLEAWILSTTRPLWF